MKKIIKKFKNLRSGARILFVALLTICLVFASTGIGTLFVSAEEQVAVLGDNDGGDGGQSDGNVQGGESGQTDGNVEGGESGESGGSRESGDAGEGSDGEKDGEGEGTRTGDEITDGDGEEAGTESGSEGETTDGEKSDKEAADEAASKKKKAGETEEPERLRDTPDGSGDPSGRIIVDDYKSKKLTDRTDVVILTKDKLEIKIESDADPIYYFTSENKYYTISDIEGAVTDGKAKWKTYYDQSRPTIPSNSAFYIYAKLGDGDNPGYVSTAKMVHDTEKPVVNSAAVVKPDSSSNSGTEQVAAVVGKDKLSGVESFYLMYEELTQDSTTPTAEWVVENGTKSDVQYTEGENAAASFPLSGLYSDKTYVFYVVAKDKVGNISEVKRIETKGKGPSTKDVSGNGLDADAAGGAGSGSGSGSGSGLTPASNGLASKAYADAVARAKAQAAVRAENAARAAVQDASAQSAASQEINRNPYISDATGDVKIGLQATGSWDKIADQIQSSPAGASMDVEMSGLTVVPAKVFNAMQGKDVNVSFKMNDDMVWSVKGSDVSGALSTSTDLGIKVGSKNIPSKLLNDMAGVYPHTEIAISHDGKFGFEATLKMPLGSSNAGMFGHLYYYDVDNGELTLVQSVKIPDNGMAEFKLDHASDYAVIVRSQEVLASSGSEGAELMDRVISGSAEMAPVASGYTTISMSQVTSNNGNVRIWLFAIAIISAMMCAVILFMPGLQMPEPAKAEVNNVRY